MNCFNWPNFHKSFHSNIKTKLIPIQLINDPMTLWKALISVKVPFLTDILHFRIIKNKCYMIFFQKNIGSKIYT